MRFDDVKSETLNLRVSPSFKLALKAAADSDQRSMVNMLEVLLKDYCERNDIKSPARRPRVARASKATEMKAHA